MSASVLEIRNLRLSIRTDEGAAHILDRVELALPRGRILGVVGESGCGKSTLVRAILGILPNCISPVIVRATIGMGFTILVAAVLGFLGMGATPPDPDWGLAISESRQYLPDAWWFSTFPGLAIFLTVLGFNLLGDGLRDIVDPRLRRSR